jgi:uncharacterized protein YbjQ (UPF0145 family)
MDAAMTTTAFELTGHRTVKSLGVVRGITVRSRSIFGTIGGALHAVVGVRYDATEVMDGVTEVLCYGTAAVIEPL